MRVGCLVGDFVGGFSREKSGTKLTLQAHARPWRDRTKRIPPHMRFEIRGFIDYWGR